MKEKAIKKSVILLAVTAIMLFAMSITSFAAIGTKVTGLKQTKAYENSVYFSWNAVTAMPGYTVAGYYVYESADGKNYARKDTDKYPDASYPESYINNKSAGCVYYVKVAPVYKDANSNYYAGPLSDPLQVVTAPAKVNSDTIVETAASAAKNKVTVKWKAVSGATAYNVYVENTKVTTVSSAKATFKLVAGQDPYIRIEAVKKSASGFLALADKSYSEQIFAAPGKVTNVADFDEGNFRWNTYDNNKVKIGWNVKKGDYYADGYQIEVKSVDGKKTLKKYYVKNKYTTYKEFNIKSVKNVGFKVRVRAYKKINGKNCYGNWSSLKTIIPQPALEGKQLSATKIKVSWNKIKNATSYTIYVCKDTSVKNKKFTKYKTVSAKTRTCTISKLKKGEWAGVYVIPTVKVGGKKYKAAATWYTSFLMSKYY